MDNLTIFGPSTTSLLRPFVNSDDRTKSPLGILFEAHGVCEGTVNTSVFDGLLSNACSKPAAAKSSIAKPGAARSSRARSSIGKSSTRKKTKGRRGGPRKTRRKG